MSPSSPFYMSLGLFISLCLLALVIPVRCKQCFFTWEQQGTFIIQTQTPESLTYSELTIEAESLQPFGQCHQWLDNHRVILRDGQCMRCVHLELKTPNVLKLMVRSLARCHTSEETARDDCPKERDHKQLILFRHHLSVRHTFCPFNGRYRFTYSTDSGHEHCQQGFSELSNCPDGDVLTLKFRECSFPSKVVRLMCLGTWTDTGHRFLAVMVKNDEWEAKFEYRYGLYTEEPTEKRIEIALYADSVAHNLPLNGLESLVLTPVSRVQTSVLLENSRCEFPEWAQGMWHSVKISGNQFIHMNEQEHFRTITSTCLTRAEGREGDRFIVHSVTHCGHQYYTCLWLKRRSPSVIEFKVANSSSDLAQNLCRDIQFSDSQWFTKGKQKTDDDKTWCPISGQFTGAMPVSGLCARVSTDCHNPDVLYFSVNDCEDTKQVYEDREYRCLAHWEEDGMVYTFTQRRDTSGYQCFVGNISSDGKEAFVREAGDHCGRGSDHSSPTMRVKRIRLCRPSHLTSSLIHVRRQVVSDRIGTLETQRMATNVALSNQSEEEDRTAKNANSCTSSLVAGAFSLIIMCSFISTAFPIYLLCHNHLQ